MSRNIFTAKNSLLKKIILTKPGVYPYNDHNGQTIRVLKSEKMVQGLQDLVKMINITQGHKGDVIIGDSAMETTEGGKIIGQTGSNAMYANGALSIDCRIHKKSFEALKQSGTIEISLGARGENVLKSGVDPQYGGYDAIQHVSDVCHVACVSHARVAGCRIEDSEDALFEIGTIRLLDEEDINNNNKVKEGNIHMSETENVNNETVCEKPPTVDENITTKEENCTTDNVVKQDTNQKNTDDYPVMPTAKEIAHELFQLQKAETDRLSREQELFKQQELQKQEEEDVKKAKLQALVDAASSFLGQVPSSKQTREDDLIDYLCSKLNMKDKYRSVDYFMGMFDERKYNLSGNKGENHLNDERGTDISLTPTQILKASLKG